MELAFNRHGLKYEMIHANFLMPEQHADELFKSCHEELLALCDAITALRGSGDADPLVTEARVINQFVQGIHDRLVRSYVKRCVAQNRSSNIKQRAMLQEITRWKSTIPTRIVRV